MSEHPTAPPPIDPYDDVIDAGLSAAFGPDPATDPPANTTDGDFESAVRLRDPGVAPDAVGPPMAYHGPLTLHVVGRYPVVGMVARGGMGEVLRACDGTLGRELAVKLLLERHLLNPAMARRFAREAQITGQLQHPGVPPVHEFGRTADGRPYFTMKLVHGRTLADMFAARRDSAEDRPGFLRVFLQVCQTIAYAHSRGVVHRDLKPANVMVGAFGEVQVMDWGLADVIDGGAAGPPAVVAVGTPGYMPPEQARGIDKVDERADVFGLGAILCVLLTGKPPYPGSTAAGAIRQAVSADLSDAWASLDGCAAPPELLRLARCCLAPDPADRPRDAAAVERAVTDYLGAAERRLRDAEIAGAEAKAAAGAERRQRRLAVALAVSVVGTLLAAGGTWVLAERGRQARVADRTARANEALAEAAQLRGQAQQAGPADPAIWEWAAAAARRAEEAAGDADPEVRARAERLRAELDDEKRRAEARAAEAARDRWMMEELDEIRLRRADRHDNRPDPGRSDDDYRRAFASYGIDLDRPDESAAVVRSSPIRAALLDSLDDWAFQPGRAGHRDRVLAVVRASDPEPGGWSARVREALRRKDVAGLKQLAGADAAGVPPARVAVAASILTQNGEPAAAEALLRRAHDRHPGDFWINHELAMTLVHRPAPRYDEAVRFHTAAVAARPQSPAARFTLGNALLGQGRPDEAVAAWAAALALRPDFAPAHNQIGVVRFQQGRFDDALAAFRAAARARPDFAVAHNNIANVLHLQGKLVEAIAAAGEAVRHAPDLLRARTALAAMLQEQGKYAEGLAVFREAEALVAKNPKLAADFDPHWIRDAEKAAELAPRWPALLRGEVKPATAAERVAWAKFAHRQKRHPAMAARLYAAAFADVPELAADTESGRRYDAACAAAQAGCGRGADAPPAESPDRPRLRRLALDWLTADLAHWSGRAKEAAAHSRRQVVETLTLWQGDPDLAGVRGGGLEELAGAERAAWQRLWADVAALVKAAGG